MFIVERMSGGFFRLSHIFTSPNLAIFGISLHTPVLRSLHISWLQWTVWCNRSEKEQLWTLFEGFACRIMQIGAGWAMWTTPLTKGMPWKQTVSLGASISSPLWFLTKRLERQCYKECYKLIHENHSLKFLLSFLHNFNASHIARSVKMQIIYFFVFLINRQNSSFSSIFSTHLTVWKSSLLIFKRVKKGISITE